jgi:hypothetical protein
MDNYMIFSASSATPREHGSRIEMPNFFVNFRDFSWLKTRKVEENYEDYIPSL